MDAEYTFHIIDDILIEDAMIDSQAGGNVVKSRAIFNKAYDRIRYSGSNDEDSAYYAGSSQGYREAEQTEMGYRGFDAPMG